MSTTDETGAVQGTHHSGHGEESTPTVEDVREIYRLAEGA